MKAKTESKQFKIVIAVLKRILSSKYKVLILESPNQSAPIMFTDTFNNELTVCLKYTFLKHIERF